MACPWWGGLPGRTIAVSVPSAQSQFTALMRRTALASWKATVTVPVGFLVNFFRESQEKRAQRSSLGNAAADSAGCLSVLFLGVTITMLKLMLGFMVMAIFDMGVAAFALLVTVLWGMGIAVDRLRGTRSA